MKGLIPYIRIGKALRFRKSAIDLALARLTRTAGVQAILQGPSDHRDGLLEAPLSSREATRKVVAQRLCGEHARYSPQHVR